MRNLCNWNIWTQGWPDHIKTRSTRLRWHLNFKTLLGFCNYCNLPTNFGLWLTPFICVNNAWCSGLKNFHYHSASCYWEILPKKEIKRPILVSAHSACCNAQLRLLRHLHLSSRYHSSAAQNIRQIFTNRLSMLSLPLRRASGTLVTSKHHLEILHHRISPKVDVLCIHFTLSDKSLICHKGYFAWAGDSQVHRDSYIASMHYAAIPM